MKYAIYLGMLFLMVSGCKPGIPSNLIQPEQMAKILYDIHLTDSYINSIAGQDSAKRVAASYYKGIYKKFEIDSALYSKSMDYYSDHPDEFSKIYIEVTKDLTKQKTVLVKADSIVNAKLVKTARLRFKRDSTKRADSIAKTPAFKKAALKKKTDSLKKADSVSKASLLKKQVIKKKLDSVKRNSILQKTKKIK